MGYNPDSDDAMFSRIMEKIENLAESLARIESRQIADSRRISSLEMSRREQKAKVGTIAFVVSSLTALGAWYLEWRNK